MLDRTAIEGALDDLARSLEPIGVNARIYVVEGAAMVLDYDTRASTEDVDADLHPEDLVREQTREVAHRRDLPADWLSDSAKIFLPSSGREPRWTSVIKRGAVETATIDPEALLAMKLRASRARRDGPDIAFLCKRLGINSVEEAIALHDEYFPGDPLPERAVDLLKGILRPPASSS